jgi:hypothetical protein
VTTLAHGEVGHASRWQDAAYRDARAGRRLPCSGSGLSALCSPTAEPLLVQRIHALSFSVDRQDPLLERVAVRGWWRHIEQVVGRGVRQDG